MKKTDHQEIDRFAQGLGKWLKVGGFFFSFKPFLYHDLTGSTISTLLHDRINPKDCQVLFLGDTGFLQFFRVVSRDYGKPRLRLFQHT